MPIAKLKASIRRKIRSFLIWSELNHASGKRSANSYSQCPQFIVRCVHVPRRADGKHVLCCVLSSRFSCLRCIAIRRLTCTCGWRWQWQAAPPQAGVWDDGPEAEARALKERKGGVRQPAAPQPAVLLRSYQPGRRHRASDRSWRPVTVTAPVERLVSMHGPRGRAGRRPQLPTLLISGSRARDDDDDDSVDPTVRPSCTPCPLVQLCVVERGS